jgi:hypothetical protein
MYHKPSEQPGADLSRAAPSDAVRERVLRACRRELAARAVVRRRRRMAHWGLVAGVAVMLAVNNVEEQRMAARIETLVRGPRVVVFQPRSTSTIIAAWRAREVMLAALLLDPHAL